MKEFQQKVKHYYPQGEIAILQSKKGKAYICRVSDKVRYTKNMREGDMAVVRIINKRNWIIVDVKPRVDETESYAAEIPLTEMGYDY